MTYRDKIACLAIMSNGSTNFFFPFKMVNQRKLGLESVHFLVGETVKLGLLEGNGAPAIGKLLFSVPNSVFHLC